VKREVADRNKLFHWQMSSKAINKAT